MARRRRVRSRTQKRASGALAVSVWAYNQSPRSAARTLSPQLNRIGQPRVARAVRKLVGTHVKGSARNVGSFDSRQGKWVKGKGGRFIGSSG